MESSSFTLDYFGKKVAVEKEADIYIVQISYKPLYIKKQEASGKQEWIDTEQNRSTQLSEEVGKLIEEHLSL